MSASIPFAKRPGEGPQQRDSKKMRSLGVRGSDVSLPRQESIHSTMSGIQEQRGWELGNVFTPRPAVRLSGTPQYPTPTSVPSTSHSRREPVGMSPRAAEKRPVTRDKQGKRPIIGREADDLDSGDIRVLLERDAKRKEKRKQEYQEKLDRKLRNRAGRNRGDSDNRRKEADVVEKQEQRRDQDVEVVAQQPPMPLPVEEIVSRGLMTPPPTDVHPAFRDRTSEDAVDSVGLRIEATDATAVVLDPEHDHTHALPTTEEKGTANTGTYLSYPPEGDLPQNPFADPTTTTTIVAEPTRQSAVISAFSPLAIPFEDPADELAHSARLSQLAKPSLSSLNTSSLSPVQTGQSQYLASRLSQSQVSDLPAPPALSSADIRRSSEPKGRAGAWASFFRRGGTNLRRPSDEGKPAASEASFSNASRDSMRNKPPPAHLIDMQPAGPQRKSGPPVRTQSKFREDLPELPLSPPLSRTGSPDVTTMAAAAAAARRARKTPTPVTIPADQVTESDAETPLPGRSDTPVSPGRARGLVSASMASVDSEGSWIAGAPGKRQSTQSALSRSIGSLSKRRPDFTASYEELGADRDAEHFQHVAPNTATERSSAALAVASPDSGSDYGDEAAATAPTVHDGVRRQPTLVHRDSRTKSKEVLLSDDAAGADLFDGGSPLKDEFDPEESDSRVQSARSVNYGKSHVRHVSAGSAKLLDIPAKRQSTDTGSRAPSTGSRL